MIKIYRPSLQKNYDPCVRYCLSKMFSISVLNKIFCFANLSYLDIVVFKSLKLRDVVSPNIALNFFR